MKRSKYSWFYLVFILLLASGCGMSDKEKLADYYANPDKYCVIGNIFYPVKRSADGCQYIGFHNAYGGSYSHLGTCDNPIHNTKVLEK